MEHKNGSTQIGAWRELDNFNDESSDASEEWELVNLSTIFHDVVQSIKDSPLFSDHKLFFASADYKNHLQRLGKFLFLVESTIPRIKKRVSNVNIFFTCCSVLLEKSIENLKHSMWFLHSVQIVEDGKKSTTFQHGIDLFGNAVGTIDELIKLFWSDDAEAAFSSKGRGMDWASVLVSVSQLRSRSQSLLLQSFTKKGMGPTSLGSEPAADKTHESTVKPLGVFPCSQTKPVFPLDFSWEPCDSTVSNFPTPSDSSNFSKTPGSAVTSLDVSPCSQAKRISPLNFSHKPCDNTFSNFPTVSNSSNGFSKLHGSIVKSLDVIPFSQSEPFTPLNFSQEPFDRTFSDPPTASNSSSSSKPLEFIENPFPFLVGSGNSPDINSNLTDDNVLDERHEQKIVENCKEGYKNMWDLRLQENSAVNENEAIRVFLEQVKFSPSTYNSLATGRSFTFDKLAHQQRFAQICRNIKDEVKYFEPVKAKKLKFQCLLCKLTMPSRDVEIHTNDPIHLHNKAQDNKKGSFMSPNLVLSSNAGSSENTIKFSAECETSPYTSLAKKFNFAKIAHQERFAQICRNIKDEVKYFEPVRAKKLKFQCLLCKLTMPSRDVEKHTNDMIHVQKKMQENKGGSDFGLDSVLQPNPVLHPNPVFHENSTCSFDESITSLCTSLTPGKIFTFDKVAHQERFAQICRNIRGEVKYFEPVKAKKLKFQCLLCKLVMPSRDVEIHTKDSYHKHMKSKSSKEDCSFELNSNLSALKALNAAPNSSLLSFAQPDFNDDLGLQNSTKLRLNPSAFKEHSLTHLSETFECSGETEREKWAVKTLAVENLFQDATNFKALQFLSVEQKEQFQNLVNKINYQINFFSVDSHQQSDELTLTCQVCDIKMHVSKVKEHTEVQKHLLNVVSKCKRSPSTQGISEQDMRFLEFDAESEEYICTLCDEVLSSDQISWPIHFQSELHLANTIEQHLPISEEKFYSTDSDDW